MTVGELQKIEPTLNEVTAAKLLKAEPGAKGGYTVESESVPTKNVFTIVRTETGAITRTCTKVGTGACPPTGTW